MIEQSVFNENLQMVREESPLVHSITNFVVMNFTANALLAIGASPVMAHASEEMEEMVSISSSLVLNIGTLSNKWIESMHIAGKIAKKKGKPIVLDPVGAGATFLRTSTAHTIMDEVRPDIIRGNASEILAVAKSAVSTKGVESTLNPEDVIEVGKELATKTGSVISISGETDYITDGKTVYKVTEGHQLMRRVTGTGCAASVLTAAFASVNKDYLTAATCAMMAMGKAAVQAGKEASSPGTFNYKFIDALYNLGK